MENELTNFIKLSVTVATSLTYVYFISSKIPKGIPRLISILPIIYILVLLPLQVSSFMFQFTTGFSIGWQANFKLLLFAFDKGPLSPFKGKKSLSFLLFIFLGSFSIKQKENSPQDIKDQHTSAPLTTNTRLYSSLAFLFKSLIWFTLTILYTYRDLMHPLLVRVIYAFRMAYLIQLILDGSAGLARIILGYEFEPQFDYPHLSTSLQNFWGVRWNRMTNDILRASVYDPVKSLLNHILSKDWAKRCAILSTFGVSGLMHDMLYYYSCRTWPTWEVTWFFLIHGVAVIIEIEVKKRFKGRWTLNQWVSRGLTVGFVLSTISWLCFVQLSNCGADVKEFKEYLTVAEYAKYILTRIKLI